MPALHSFLVIGSRIMFIGRVKFFIHSIWIAVAFSFNFSSSAAESSNPSNLKIPRFSVENMDRSVDPATDFYHFAAGTWLKKNPVPPDKSRWSGFEELQERSWVL